MEKLIQGLHRFQANYVSTHRDLFEQLARGQSPRVLFITCSDSRVDPALITQAQIGELFVIRNAGNIIPPFRSANGGEGATLEYAIHALGVQQIIVCGHSQCGAMKGLLKMETLREEMPLVHDWLQHAESTRRLVKESYSHCRKEDLIDIAVMENVLSQLDNLNTYPVVRTKLHQGQLALHGWIYQIESGQVLAYDAQQHQFVLPHSHISAPEPIFSIHHSCSISDQPVASSHSPLSSATGTVLPGFPHLPPQQAERIYRGSTS